MSNQDLQSLLESNQEAANDSATPAYFARRAYEEVMASAQAATSHKARRGISTYWDRRSEFLVPVGKWGGLIFFLQFAAGLWLARNIGRHFSDGPYDVSAFKLSTFQIVCNYLAGW